MTQPQQPPAFVTEPPRAVLFLCVHNSARSQMAEGLARALAPSDTRLWSAGTQPGKVHPLAIEVMREAGIDISSQRSKALEVVPWRDADTVVTLCGEAEETCLQLATAVRRIHWPLPDPAAAPEAEAGATFREVRDEIRWRVSSLWPRGD